METHLRYAGADPQTQARVLVEMLSGQPHLMRILKGIDALGLPDGLLGAGVIYNTVWNILTNRPTLTGINDADVAYFDESDLSYEAEDARINQANRLFADLPFLVELRNQARVHLWFAGRFGFAYPKLSCSADMMLFYATRTHAVAARLEANGEITILAPFGLVDLFSFQLTPNPVLPNRKTHEQKAERAKSIWPELTIVPWP